MEGVIDFEELERRKKSRLPKKRIVKKKNEEKVPQWFEKVMTPDDFTIMVSGEGLYYVKHNAWKNGIFVGPYSDKKVSEKIVAEYVKNSKKPPLKRKPIANLHSTIIEDTTDFKVV